MYLANADRYDGRMPYRTCGNSGLRLPAITLGLWHNFGDSTPLQTQRDMWPGPYGSGGGSRKYLLASLDQSLQRMGLDYVDIFYSHRFDPDTPLEETMGALATAVQQGKALYVGISSYSAKKTAEASKLLRDMGIPCLIHQPSYSLLNRWIEAELLDTLQAEGMGCIAFSPLAQGLLTDRYLNGVPADSRMNRPGGQSLKVDHVSPENVARIKGLNDIAAQRGQTLAQMAVAWVLRDPRVTSALIGASKPAQISELVGAVKNLNFDAATLSAIDELAVDGGVNLWQKPSTDQRP
jgi:L-glyceraldehyde 3-phosphate reductase